MEMIFWIFGLVQLTAVYSINISNETLSDQYGELVRFIDDFGIGSRGKLEAAENIKEALNEIGSKSFLITGGNGGNEKCELHTKILYERANQYDVWALKSKCAILYVRGKLS